MSHTLKDVYDRIPAEVFLGRAYLKDQQTYVSVITGVDRKFIPPVQDFELNGSVMYTGESRGDLGQIQLSSLGLPYTVSKIVLSDLPANDKDITWAITLSISIAKYEDGVAEIHIGRNKFGSSVTKYLIDLNQPI